MLLVSPIWAGRTTTVGGWRKTTRKPCCGIAEPLSVAILVLSRVWGTRTRMVRAFHKITRKPSTGIAKPLNRVMPTLSSN